MSESYDKYSVDELITQKLKNITQICWRKVKDKTSWRAVTCPLDSDPIWPYISHMNKKTQQHLSIPENRINYSFHFLDNFGYEFVDYKKCYDAIAKWSDKLDTSESFTSDETFLPRPACLLSSVLILGLSC